MSVESAVRGYVGHFASLLVTQVVFFFVGTCVGSKDILSRPLLSFYGRFFGFGR